MQLGDEWMEAEVRMCRCFEKYLVSAEDDLFSGEEDVGEG